MFKIFIFLFLIIKISHVISQGSRQRGYGEPCSNRAFWSSVNHPEIDSLIRTANLERTRTLYQRYPWSDALYLDYVNKANSGVSANRDVIDAIITNRMSRLENFVVAECIRWDGTYLNQLENELISISLQKSWTSPAIDLRLNHFNGRLFQRLSDFFR